MAIPPSPIIMADPRKLGNGLNKPAAHPYPIKLGGMPKATQRLLPIDGTYSFISRVDQLQQVFTVAPDRLHGFNSFRRGLIEAAFVQKDFREPQNSGHRCANLVTHVGQKFAFGDIGAFGSHGQSATLHPDV